MTRRTTRLGATVAALVLLGGASALAVTRPVVELEKDSCAGPVAAAMTAADGSVVFHNMDAGRYVVTLPAETGAMSVAVAEGGTDRWVSGRLSAVTDGRRYAVGSDGQRLVVAVTRGGGEIHVRLGGR